MKTILPVGRPSRLGPLLVAVLTVQPIVQALAQSDLGPQGGTRKSIPDVELVDQDAKRVHLYHDLVKGRVAALSFIFTTCTTICPLIGANLGRLQTELGQSSGCRIQKKSTDCSTSLSKNRAFTFRFCSGSTSFMAITRFSLRRLRAPLPGIQK